MPLNFRLVVLKFLLWLEFSFYIKLHKFDMMQNNTVLNSHFRYKIWKKKSFNLPIFIKAHQEFYDFWAGKPTSLHIVYRLLPNRWASHINYKWPTNLSSVAQSYFVYFVKIAQEIFHSLLSYLNFFSYVKYAVYYWSSSRATDSLGISQNQ